MTATTVPGKDESCMSGAAGEDIRRYTKQKLVGKKKERGEGRCLNLTALQQLVQSAQSSGPDRQAHPDLLEGLDLALAHSDDLGRVTPQLVLKAFEHVPSAQQLQQLQQLLASSEGTAVSGLAAALQPALDSLLKSSGALTASVPPGDYLVLQTPVIAGIEATVTAGGKVTAQQTSVPQPALLRKQSTPAGSCPQQQKSWCKEALASSSAEGGAAKGPAKAAKRSLDDSKTGEECKLEHSALEMELQSLRKHKEWADQKIDQLIRRVREAEGPQRLLKEEVQQLRLEKDHVEGKLEEFEKSLQKLKDCTYTEAAQRREYELSLLNAQAELRGSSLREQEVQKQLRDAQSTLRQERKRREVAERQLKKVTEQCSEAQAAAAEAAQAAAGTAKELQAVQQALQEQLMETQAAQDALLTAQQQAKAAQQRTGDLVSQLAAATASQANHTSELDDLKGVIAALTTQLDAHSGTASQAAQSSLYSHFSGPALFERDGSWLQDAGFPGLAALGPMNAFAVDLNRMQPAQPNFGSRGAPATSVARPGANLQSQGGVEVP